MPAHDPTVAPAARRAGRLLSGFAILFLLFDSVLKLLVLDPVKETMAGLGYPEGLAFGIGVVELVCLAAYVVPRTAIHGAILLTGFLGGAVATHVRTGSPWFSHTLFPLYVGALIWGGLLLRDRRAREFLRGRPTATGLPG